jgi:hypothetical protein
MSTESNDPTGSEPTPDPGYTPPDPGPATPPPATPPPPPPPAAEPPPSYQSSPSPTPAAGPSAMSNFDFASVSRSVWISLGGAVVLLVSVFFSWYSVSVKNFGSTGYSGWDATDVAKLVFLLALVAIAAWGVELFAPQIALPFPAWMIAGGAGALAILLVLFRILSKPGGSLNSGFAKALGVSVGTSFGIYLALIAAIAVVVGAYLRMNESSS